MHFGAYLEICDLQLSRYKEINNNNNNKPKNNPSNWILYSKIHTCSQRSQHLWERKFVRSITISVQEVLLSSASVHYAGLPSPGQLSPAFWAPRWLQGFCSWCTQCRPHFTFDCPAVPGELPVLCCCFRLTGIKGIFF